MKNLLCFTLILGTLALGGCAPVTLPTGTPAVPAATPNRRGTIRVGFSTSADVGDVPSLMAHELLRSQGYTIESTEFTSADLMAAALAQEEIDIGSGSMRTMWLAFDKRAFARTLMEQIANDWFIVTKPEFKTCADLEGKRIAFTNNSSLSYALFQAYKQEHCPNLQLEQLLIPSSDNRASALLAGELEAAPLQLSDWLDIQQKAPNRFHVLIDFAHELPNLKTTGVYASQTFADQQPQAVRDYIRALLTVHRKIQKDPAILEAAMVKFLGVEPLTAQTMAQAYLALGRWDANGGLDREDVQYSIDFFTRTGTIPKGLTVDGVADLSYLNAVLAEMGRK